MKYLRKKQKNTKVLLIIAGIVCVVAIAAIALIHFWDEGPARPAPTETAADSVTEAAPTAEPTAETVEATDAAAETAYQPVADFEVELPYYSIVFSGSWGNHLRVDVADNIARFVALIREEDVPLFDIIYNGEGDTLCYLMDAEGKLVSVSVYVHDIAVPAEWSEDDMVAAFGMQNQIDSVIEQLENAEQTEFADPEDPQTQATDEDLLIETPYTVLRYPMEWKPYLQTETNTQNGCVVSFYCQIEGKERIHLFDVFMGAKGEDYIGLLTADDGSVVELSITSYDVMPDESWTEDEANTVMAMMDGVSHILASLEADGRLVC